ncbi:collagen-like protein [Capnocytophaga sp. oral taxon 338]|uniref:collagen-like protein n=1 Tax=Capnocytophaga sp. oral taxon 338 TaxID=710239 RepID=UPI000202B2BD|nr:collagen-like protein [Capnocytophaga sp. oral taxon 338]EGD35358.1 hypothetical protein HMPREF9071_0142 [Capnocytophaga sp. oral taxon 338 str. F0234]
MKKYLLPLLVVALTATHCTKEGEKVVVQEKVTHGSTILSGNGTPSTSQGEKGDYYLDLKTANLYGPKTTDWGSPVLNLKGIAGKDGKDGQNGQPGTNGKDAPVPHIKDGYWYVGDQSTGIKAQGEKGQEGRPGRDGQPGAKGNDGQNGQPGTNGKDAPVPHIKDGYWYVGDQPTGIKAQGEKGQEGRPGRDGQPGQPGTNGRDGQPGQDGSKILAGDRAPQATDGAVGDYFIDKAAKIFYGPKTTSGWPSTGISLVANQVTTADYELSNDGKTLVKWLNEKTRVIDMNTDPKLKNVEKIEANAFNAQTNNLTYQLTTIIIGERVREIGMYAFNLCRKLKEVEFPEGITKINSGTFAECYNLFSITLPESLIEIGNGAFSSCIKLPTIIFPKKVNKIGNNAFKNCPNLHSIILENRTAFEIKPLQFGNSDTLQNIFVPKGTETAYKNSIADANYKAKVKGIGI